MADIASEFYQRFFKDPQGNPKVRNAYVAFVDLLGVRQLILETPDHEVEAMLSRLRDALAEADSNIAVDKRFNTRIVRYYSDCVSIISPALPGHEDEQESQFGYTVDALARWQLNMVLKGYFVRGGLEHDLTFVDEFSLFGKAHLEAYLLESTRAKFPRIILGKRVIEMCRVHMSWYANEPYTTPHESEVLVDSDGEAFLNYLDILREDEAETSGFGKAEHWLNVHSEVIKQGLVDAPNDHVRAKYEWVRSYHNWFCSMNWGINFDSRKLKLGDQVADFKNFRTGERIP